LKYNDEVDFQSITKSTRNGMRFNWNTQLGGGFCNPKNRILPELDISTRSYEGCHKYDLSSTVVIAAAAAVAFAPLEEESPGKLRLR
jgi:hypothetical protein